MKTRLFLILTIAMITATGMLSCEKTYDAPNVFSTVPAPGDSESSFSLIQTEVLDKNCISCHTAGMSFATQSDLVLTADVSYEQLVGRQPKNTAAREDGLLLVGTAGLASVQKLSMGKAERPQSRAPLCGSPALWLDYAVGSITVD